jgi:hypothetical protein
MKVVNSASNKLCNNTERNASSCGRVVDKYMQIRGIQNFPKYINKNYYVLPRSYSAPSLSNSSLGSAHADPSFSAASELHPGSISLIGYLGPSALEYPQLYQIFPPSN